MKNLTLRFPGLPVFLFDTYLIKPKIALIVLMLQNHSRLCLQSTVMFHFLGLPKRKNTFLFLFEKFNMGI